MNPRGDKLMNSAELEPLVNRLVRYVAAATKKAESRVDRERVRVSMALVSMAARVPKETRPKRRPKSLREAAPLLAQVREILTSDRGGALNALLAPAPGHPAGADPVLSIKESIQDAAARHGALVRDLEKIQQAIPSLPPRRAGRPLTSKDLRFLVKLLAMNWKSLTRTPFKPYWLNGKPGNYSTSFVQDVVAFVDPESLNQLPQVMRQIRAEWLKRRPDAA
jgi:hypothetical protein